MGDHVVFLNRQYSGTLDPAYKPELPFYLDGGGNYVAGGSSGWSGFPFSWIPGVGVTSASGIFPPGPVSLQTAGYYYWRVRKWHLSGTIALSRDYDDGMGGTGTITCTATFDDIQDVWAGIATRERDLILNNDMTATFNGTWDSSSPTVQSGAATAHFALFSSLGQRLWFDATSGTNYYPYLDFTPFMDVITIPGTTDNSMTAIAQASPPSGNRATTNFNGINVSMYGDTGYFLTSADCSLVLAPASGTADAFWPYANADGSPKYNTTTGALL